MVVRQQLGARERFSGERGQVKLAEMSLEFLTEMLTESKVENGDVGSALPAAQ